METKLRRGCFVCLCVLPLCLSNVFSVVCFVCKGCGVSVQGVWCCVFCVQGVRCASCLYVCGVACSCVRVRLSLCVSVQGVWCCVFVCKECGIVKTCLFFRDVVTHTTKSEDPFAQWSCCLRCWSMLVLFRAVDFAPKHMRIRHMAGNGVTAVIVDGGAPAILAQDFFLLQRNTTTAKLVCCELCVFVARSSCSPQFQKFFCLCVLIRVPCLLVFQHSLAGIFSF